MSSLCVECYRPAQNQVAAVFAFDPSPAFGEDSVVINDIFKKAKDHYLRPVSRKRNNPEIKFQELKATWEEETLFLSSSSAIVLHPAYQQIIGMGKDALPLIMNELSLEPSHWFWALRAITRENPVPSTEKGKIEKMAKYWLIWWAEYKNRK